MLRAELEGSSVAAIIAAIGVAMASLSVHAVKWYRDWSKARQEEQTGERKSAAQLRREEREMGSEVTARAEKLISDYTGELKAQVADLKAQVVELRKVEQENSRTNVIQAREMSRLEERLKNMEEAESECQKRLADLLDSHRKLKDEYAKLAQGYLDFTKTRAKRRKENDQQPDKPKETP